MQPANHIGHRSVSFIIISVPAVFLSPTPDKRANDAVEEVHHLEQGHARRAIEQSPHAPGRGCNMHSLVMNRKYL